MVVLDQEDNVTALLAAESMIADHSVALVAARPGSAQRSRAGVVLAQMSRLCR